MCTRFIHASVSTSSHRCQMSSRKNLCCHYHLTTWTFIPLTSRSKRCYAPPLSLGIFCFLPWYFTQRDFSNNWFGEMSCSRFSVVFQTNIPNLFLIIIPFAIPICLDDYGTMKPSKSFYFSTVHIFLQSHHFLRKCVCTLMEYINTTVWTDIWFMQLAKKM